MASLLKKTFAAVLAIAMVVTCFTVSAADAAPSINGSTGYIDFNKPGEVSVTFSTENFTAIYGSQFSITIPDGFGFVNIETKDPEGVEWVKDSNYVVKEVEEKDVITFLDVRTDKGFDITLTMNCADTSAVNAVNDVTIANELFIDSNEATYDGVVINAAAVSVTNQEYDVPSVPVDKDGYFIPYGSVITDKDVNNNPTYAQKGEEGSYTTAGTTVSYFKLPKEEVGVTTFGVSENSEEYSYAREDGKVVTVPAGIQFGSYAIDTDGKTFGTIVVSGDLDAFKKHYAENFTSDKAFYDRFVALCAENGTVSLGYGENANNRYKHYIKVACVERTTYLWKGTAGAVAGHLQYALRIINHKQDGKYYGIGYNTADNVNYNYSENVQKYLGQ